MALLTAPPTGAAAPWGRTLRWPERLALALHGLLVVTVALHHEPWFDEAQAWLMARDLAPWDLVTRWIRYEGTPPLWHLWLAPFAKAGMPYRGINLLSAGIAVGGAWLFLRWSPLPRAISLLVPFTFFLGYQYAVVARSYVLLAPLMFAVALLYPWRHSRLGSLGALLVAIALSSMYGWAIAAGILGAHLFETAEAWPRLHTEERWKHALLYSGFALLSVAIAVMLWPPADLAFARGLRPEPAKSAATLLDGALTGFAPLTVAVLAVTLLWLRHRGSLAILLLPLGLQLAIASVKWSNQWHQGAVWLTWLFAVGVSLDRREPRAGREDAPPRLRSLLTAAVAAVCSIHLYWCARSAIWDLRNPYSGSAAAATYLLELDTSTPHGLRTAGVFGFALPAYAMLPYFDHNPFANHNRGELPTFYLWTTNRPPPAATNGPPEIVVAGFKEPAVYLGTPPRTLPGYRLERIFPGGIFWKTEPYEDDTILIFRRDAAAAKLPGGALPDALQTEGGVMAAFHSPISATRNLGRQP